MYIKVVACGDVLPRDPPLENYYMSLTIAKIDRSKKFHHIKFGHFLTLAHPRGVE